MTSLAAAGFPDRPIAPRSLVSPRTVGVRAYRAFPKLGITFRTAPRRALEAGTTAAAAP